MKLFLFVSLLVLVCFGEETDDCDMNEPVEGIDGQGLKCDGSCVVDDDGMCVKPSIEPEPEPEPEPAIDCTEDAALRDWKMEYIGKSTQFRLYDPCDNRFIKFKMEDLTEYSGEDNTKTNQKEVSFASSDWVSPTGGYTTYQGVDCIMNRWEADDVAQGAGRFALETILFKEDDTLVNADGTEVTVKRNNLEFNIYIAKWDYLDEKNYLVLNIDIMTNKGGDMVELADEMVFYLDAFKIETVGTATCSDSDGNFMSEMKVTCAPGSNGGGNHKTLSFTFWGKCDIDEEMFYDPLVSYDFDEDDNEVGDVISDADDVDSTNDEANGEGDVGANSSGVQSLYFYFYVTLFWIVFTLF